MYDPNEGLSSLVSKIAPRLVYHGTATPNATKIMRRGFKNSEFGMFRDPKTGNDLQGVYTSTKQRGAEGYAAPHWKATGPERKGSVIRSMAVGPAKARHGDVHLYDRTQLIPGFRQNVSRNRVDAKEIKSQARRVEDRRRAGKVGYGTVNKSYLGNGAWKAASQVPKGELRAALGAHPKADWAGNAAGRKIRRGMSLPKGKTVTTSYHPALRSNAPGEDGLRASGIAYGNGKGGGHIKLDTLTPPDKQDKVMRHEMAHISPRRNPRHLSDRMFDPVKRGREEGRASFIEYGRPNPGGHDSGINAKFKLGYDEVQNKMQAARQRKVSKSYLGAGKWKAATRLTPGQALKVPGAHLKAHGPTRADSRFKRQMAVATKDVSAKPQGVRVDPIMGHNNAGTVRTGSAKSGKSYVVGSASSKRTADLLTNHEAQHANIKRSSYRLHAQIAKDPDKLMREEARADYMGSGKHYSQKKNELTSSRYQTLANMRDSALNHPNRPSRGSALAADMWGGDRMKNKTAYRYGAASYVAQQKAAFGGHYGKGGPEAVDSSIDAYRGLQNKMRDKGVSKSYLGGAKGWVRAGEAGARALRRAKGAHKAARGVSVEDQGYKIQQALRQSAIEDGIAHGHVEQMPNGHTKITRFSRAYGRLTPDPALADGTHAYALKQGGRKGKGYLFVNELSNDSDIAHEMAHLTPKRSAYRMNHQTMQDGRKYMREEARADMEGSSYHRDPDAAGSGYKDMANDDKYRRKMSRGRAAESIAREVLTNKQGLRNGIKQGWKKRPYSKESMDDFRNIQDKIATAKGNPHAPKGAPEQSSKSHKFYGNQYVKWGAGMTGAAAFGGGGAAFYAHKKQQDEHLIEKGMLNNLGAKVGAHYNVGLNRVANAIEPKPVVPAVHRRVAPIVRSGGRTYGAPPKPGTLTRVANHPLVRPVRSVAADQVREVAHDATPIWEKVEDYIGKRAPQSFNPHDGISAEVSRR